MHSNVQYGNVMHSNVQYGDVMHSNVQYGDECILMYSTAM